MKKLILALLSSICLSSCVVYADPPVYVPGCINYCDAYGCKAVCGTYYTTSNGDIIYWDAHLGCWIGPHGYWYHGTYYHGYHPSYHYYYGHTYHGGHGSYHGGHRR